MEENNLETLEDGQGGDKKRQGTAKYHRTSQSDGTFLTLRHAFGVTGGVRNNVAFVAVPDPDSHDSRLMIGYLVHSVGQQVRSGLSFPVDFSVCNCAFVPIRAVCSFIKRFLSTVGTGNGNTWRVLT